MQDDEKVNINPKDNTYLLGQDKAEQILLNAWKNNSLHNSWLLSGVEGIGKATLAYRFARFLLAADWEKRAQYTSLEVSENNPVYKLIFNNAHPDLKIIERDYTDTDKRKILKAIKDGEQLSDEEMRSLKKSAFIRVDDVRTINEFLTKRSADNNWRIVIIDSIDDMNPASANAVLKILEEPPYKTVMIDNSVASLLRRYRPSLSEKAIQNLVKIASGSIGKAMVYADNEALTKYDELCKIVYAKNKFSISDLLKFCDGAISDEANYYLVQELILKFIAENVKTCERPDEVAGAWDNAIKVFNETERLNLDKKQALINVITHLVKVI